MRVEGPKIFREDVVLLATLPVIMKERFPGKPAMIFGDRTTTWAEFDAGSARLCATWQAAGLRPGDRIGYFGKNSDRFYHVLFAAARGGFVLVSYNWRYAPPELAFVLADSRPKIFYYDADFTPTVEKAMKDLVDRPEIHLTIGDTPDALNRLVVGPAMDYVDNGREFDAPLVQMYTSGTTGKPKGALLSHGGVSMFDTSYAHTPQWENWSSEEVTLSAMPNFHIAGIGFVLMGMFVGATVVHTDDPSPANILRLCQQHDVKRVYMVPTIIRTVLDELDRKGEKLSLKGLYYGAAPIDPTLLKRTMDAFGCRFTQFYGMTEASTTHVLGPDQHDLAKPHQMKSVGHPLAGVAAEIRRPDGSVCDVREAGEIWIRSTMIMLGYANRPEETAQALVDGWYRTGDGGYVDEEGFLYLTDRLRDMIISGGENVYPIEVENVLKSHPKIQDAAVIGIHDDKWGELVTAVVELRNGQSLSLDELRTFTKEQLAGYKCPRALFIADSLPKTPSAKVQRGMAKTMLDQFQRIEA